MTSNNISDVEEEVDEGLINIGPYAQYTQEQKIVSAVWVHEKKFNFQTMDDIKHNFRIRFKMAPPKYKTLMSWERKLFSEGTLNTPKTLVPIRRLKHVPYVRASLKEEPNLTIQQRASKLGLSLSTLRRIMKYDLEETDIKVQKEKSNDDIEENNVDAKSNMKTENVP